MEHQTKAGYFQSIRIILAAIAFMIFSISAISAKPKPRVLVFYKTVGFHHSSIALGLLAI